jgi:hypothetical protein
MHTDDSIFIVECDDYDFSYAATAERDFLCLWPGCVGAVVVGSTLVAVLWSFLWPPQLPLLLLLQLPGAMDPSAVRKECDRPLPLFFFLTIVRLIWSRGERWDGFSTFVVLGAPTCATAVVVVGVVVVVVEEETVPAWEEPMVGWNKLPPFFSVLGTGRWHDLRAENVVVVVVVVGLAASVTTDASVLPVPN